MEDPRWLKLITVGLVLAALAVGYFLLTGKLFTDKLFKDKTAITKLSPAPSPSFSPPTSPTPTPTPMSAYNRIVARTQNQTQALPKTGFPIELAMILSISAMTIGLGLRKYPH